MFFLWTVAVLWPITCLLALGFYAVLIASNLPKYRGKIQGLLSMPGPSSGSVLSPLDSLRGLSALTVFISHFPIFVQPMLVIWIDRFPFLATAGEKAVCMFCILSGFLIYKSLLKVEGLDQLRWYCKRRFFRIFPLYLVTVLVWDILFLHYTQPLISRLSADLLMLRVIGFPTQVNVVTWSLYVEVLFYITLPLVMLVLPKKNRIALALVGIVLLVLGESCGDRTLQIWKYFLLGILAYELNEKYCARLTSMVATAIFLLGFALITLDAFNSSPLHLVLKMFGRGHEFSMGFQPQPRTLTFGIGAMLLMLGLIRSSFLGRIFSVAPLRILGTISFSLFMWQEFFLRMNFQEFNGKLPIDQPSAFLFSLIFLIPAMICFSMISFVFIERPFLNWSKRTAASH